VLYYLWGFKLAVCVIISWNYGWSWNHAMCNYFWRFNNWMHNYLRFFGLYNYWGFQCRNAFWCGWRHWDLFRRVI